MSPSILFVALVVSNIGLAALAQKLTLLIPQSTPQCADVQIFWTGGVPLFSLSVGTTDDANISSFSFAPQIQKRNSDFLFDWPAGTPFTITIQDNNGGEDTSQRLVVGPSTNSSCLDDASDIPPDPSSSNDSSSQISTGSISSTQTSLPASLTSSPKGSQTQGGSPTRVAGADNNESDGNATKKKSGPPIAIIAGIAIGVLVIIVVIGLFIFLRKRKQQRHSSSRNNLIRTFGDERAGLDAPGEDEVPQMAIPDPFVYRPVTRGQTVNMGSAGSGIRRNPTSSSHVSHSTAGEGSLRSPTTPGGATPSRKGERYLPDYGAMPTPGTNSNARMQDEDIDRLAAKMVALMSSGRMTDQAWTPTMRKNQDGDLDFVEDELPQAAPPMYNEVTRGNPPPSRPTEGGGEEAGHRF